MANKGSSPVGQIDPLFIAGHSVSVGDTIEFTTERNGRTDVYRVVLGDIEHRKLFKVVGNNDLYYTILPAVEVWGNDTKLDSVGVVYHNASESMLLVTMMQLSEGICRTQGQHRAHKVVNVNVVSMQPVA